MKKILLLIVVFMNCSILFAAPALKVKSGNWSNIKSENLLTYVEFDYSNAKWENGKTYEAFCGDTYASRVAASISDFVDTYNTISSGMKMSTSSDEARYKFVFRIKNLERKQGMSMWGRFYIRIYGNIEIYDLSNESLICEISVNGHSGGDDFVPEDRLSKCFRNLAEQLFKLKK